MKVCGFTFIRNAVKYDFPIVEAIQSVLPLCDKVIVAVGNSDDKTLELVEQIAPGKVEVLQTVWDDSLRKGGAVYAAETDKAFHAIPPEYDWCFYIQGDEAIHEDDIPVIRKAMEHHLENNTVEGLLFNYLHFYGTFDYVARSRKWYRSEIRVIRNDKSIRSYRDAQGFRKEGRKLNVVPIDATIYHYGWVRHPQFMQDKIISVKKYYDGIPDEEARAKAVEKEFNYSRNYDMLSEFKGTHPAVMQARIERLNWKVEVDVRHVNLKLKYRILHIIERLTGRRLFEYRNYRIIKS